MLLFLLTLFFFYEPAPSEIYTLSLHDALPIWCSSRKVNSSSKETYVTNLLVLDPENSSGTNYAVEVWEDKPRQEALMSEVALTIIGVVSKNGGVPALRAIIAAQSPKRGGGPGCGVGPLPLPQ